MPETGGYRPSTSGFVREQVELYERTGDRQGATTAGRPVVILSTVGARSGAVRKSPLMRVVHDGVLAAVGSVGGLPHHPGWYHNLRQDPRCRLRDGGDTRDMLAREVSGVERARWWERAVAAYPHYAEPQARTDRRIPVVVLEPAPTTAPNR